MNGVHNMNTGVNQRRFECVRQCLPLILMVSALALTSAPALADEPASAASSQEMGEIVVTATKRDTTIQRTPMSISAVSGAELESNGITHIEDAIRDVPSVSVRSAGPGQTELEMRGLASSGGAAPTVGFYLDDIALTPPVGSQAGKTVIDPSLYDLARIEVLRGPQGTLYGGSSMGGTIRLITNQPQLNVTSGSIAVDVSGTRGGNTPNRAINAAINIPLIQDKLALRLVATEKYDSGWIDRVVLSNFPFPTNTGCAPTSFYGCARGDVTSPNVAHRYHDVNWTHTTNFRASLLFAPTDNVQSTTVAVYQKTTQGGSNTFDNPPGAGYMAHYEPADVPEPFLDRFWMIANTTKVDLSAVSLNVSTSYWDRYQRLNQDTAEAYQSFFGFTQFPTNGQYEINPGWFPVTQFSEEVRLASKTDGSFSWIIGGYYSHLKSSAYSYTQDPNVCGLTVTTTVPTPVCAADNAQGILFNSAQYYHVTQYAFFGEASYKILTDLTFTAGGRYFNYDNILTQFEDGYFAPTGNLTPTTFNLKQKNNGFTPKFNLSYEPSDRLTLYATAAEGFRPGGVNQGVPTFCNLAAQGFNPDTVWTYEAGEKWRSVEGAVTFNAGLYYNKWNNIQQLVTPPCGFGYTANAGDATTYGPEAELSYRLTDDLTVRASGTHTHAAITSAPPGSSFGVGQQILNIPDYQANFSLNYRRNLTDGIRLTARADDTFVGKSQDVSYTFVTLQPYSIVNLHLGFEKDRESVALYVNNVANTHAQISANNTGLTTNIPSLYRIATNQPLTAGLSFRYSF